MCTALRKDFLFRFAHRSRFAAFGVRCTTAVPRGVRSMFTHYTVPSLKLEHLPLSFRLVSTTKWGETARWAPRRAVYSCIHYPLVHARHIRQLRQCDAPWREHHTAHCWLVRTQCASRHTNTHIKNKNVVKPHTACALVSLRHAAPVLLRRCAPHESLSIKMRPHRITPTGVIPQE